jgi:hypothetical protein
VGRDSNAVLIACDTALQLQPRNGAINPSRGLVLLRLNRCADAIADDNTAIVSNERSWLAWYGTGVCKAKMGDAAGGQADSAQAQTINPRTGDVFSAFGAITPTD